MPYPVLGTDASSNAFIAILLGVILAVLLFLPVAAVQYRRHGRLGLGPIAVLVSGAVYFLALWTYTLLPLPDRDAVACVGQQWIPFGSVPDIVERGVGSPGQLLANAAFLQVVLNVALFVPLGFFVRRILRRGFVVAVLLGLALSLTIELTQLTGAWGYYECAYRVFDVDDLITNTSGALLGSLVSAPIVRRRRPEALPTEVGLGRRWTGMLCDVLFIVLAAGVAQTAFRAWELYVRQIPIDQVSELAQSVLGVGVPALAQALMVLMRGRTVGEWVVAIGTVSASGQAGGAFWSRVVKYVAGVGGYSVLNASPTVGGFTVFVFTVATIVAAIPGDHRGLANALAGLRLVPSVPDAESATATVDTPDEDAAEGRR